MKFTVVVLLLLFALPSWAFAQKDSEPLKQDQVMDLVKAGMDSTALVKLIREHGVDFDVTDDYVQQLRAAKAPEGVLEALRAVKPQPLSRSKLLALVANGVPMAHVADMVRSRGISFYADEEYLQTLHLAGADDALISTVRVASDKATAELNVLASANADVYLDDHLQGHANPQGELTVKSVAGTHALRVSAKGKKDFQQTVILASGQTTKIEAHLEDVSSPPATASVPYTYPGSFAAPLAMQAREKSEDCMNIVKVWNAKLQQAMSTANFSQRGAMASQMNAINQERTATYRSTLMPQVKDLQTKMLTEIGRASSEHLDYEMVSSPMQLIQVCTDLRSLASQYQLRLLQGKPQ